MSEDEWDALGRLVDSLDNALAANELPMSDSLKITGMVSIVRNVRDGLRQFVIDGSGQNPWEHHPMSP